VQGHVFLFSDGWLVYGVQRHFQQYFSYIVAVSFIGSRKPEYPEKTTDLRTTDKLYHIMLYWSKNDVVFI
jgi:hypothetical protein